MVEEVFGEAHIPTKQPPAGTAPRLSAPYVHAGGPQHNQGSQTQGSPSAERLIWRVRRREEFKRLAREGRRVRSGPLSVTFVGDHDAEGPARVGFVLGRRIGSAVVRNRLRRRLRSALAELDPPAGWYLLGAAPAATETAYPQLRDHLESMMLQIRNRS